MNQLTEEHYSTAKPLASLVEGGGSASADSEGVFYDQVEYSYDTRGNLLSKVYSLDGETVDTVNYGYTDTVWKDRLTSFDGNNIAYDQIGNPLNWHDGATLTWQRGRQLASYTLGDTAITYAYNQDGIRTAKTVNGTATQYTVTDGTLRRLSDGTNTLEFINGTSVIFNGTEYWYVFNAQSDVIGIIDENGEYVVEYTYDSWGAPLSKTGSLANTLGTLNPFRYRGYIYDEETGWYYCQSRYYDPNVGRWLNADGYVSTGQSSQAMNMYAYCYNAPLMCVDDGGNCPRYYDEFTCPWCNHWLLENGFWYPTNERNPNVMIENSLLRDEPILYGRVATYTIEYNIDKSYAERIGRDIAKKQVVNDRCNELLVNIQTLPATFLLSRVCSRYIPINLLATKKIKDEFINTVDGAKQIGSVLLAESIPWDKPYYKYIEFYVQLDDPSRLKMSTMVYSGNSRSPIHQKRQVQWFSFTEAVELYHVGW